jgi:acyl-[acyl-carrier-protein]-phospholipid O-acyltransferase / long-chain-fatty-acid--[acyl-carrier-protein] ligase
MRKHISPPPLLLSRRFAPLFWCQFFAAFNDNFLKTSLVFLILFRAGSADAGALVTLASAIFIAPYFFLSGLGGELADRHDKARMAQRLKFAEIFVAAVSVLGFANHSLPLLFAALAGFGVIAALFGPIKYGILPDHLRREQLPAGNALVEAATFLAILAGTVVGGIAARGGGDVAVFAVLLMGFALACWLSALLIPPTGEGLALHHSLDRRHDPPSARRCAAVVGRHGDQLVLAHRHRGAVTAAAADQGDDRRQ